MNILGGILGFVGVSSIFRLTPSTPSTLGLEIFGLNALKDSLKDIREFSLSNLSLFPSTIGGFGGFSAGTISLTDPKFTSTLVPYLPNLSSVTSVPLIIPGEEMELAKLITLLQKAILLKGQEYFLHFQVSQLREHERVIKDSISFRKERIESLNQQISNLNSEISKVSAELSKLKTLVRSLKLTAPLKAQVLEAKIRELEQKLRALRQRRSQLVSQRRAEERALRSEERLLNTISRRLSLYRSRLTKIRSKLTELDSQIYRLAKKMKTDDLNPTLKKLIDQVRRAIKTKYA